MAELLISDESNIRTLLIQDSHWGMPVIKKILNTNHSTHDKIRDFKNEYLIQKDLEIPGISKVIDYKEEDGCPVIYFSYFEGFDLKHIIQNGKSDIGFAIRTGIFISNILDQLHQKNIIHKNLNGNCIQYNSELDTYCLSDFRYAVTFEERKHHLANPGTLPGDLSYISPEQTGRMNRNIDIRSDLYTLGVILYELLTGHLPFESKDPLELLHGHIARIPDPVDKLNPKIPRVLADIVNRLLEKSVENRYQTSKGIKCDLEVCLMNWDKKSAIDPFQIGSKDFSQSLQISQKLYGRKDELSQLELAFIDVISKPVKSVMISGYSGVGKSALVHEVFATISKNQGYFVQGKFEQLRRNLPYYAITQALEEYVALLMTEPDEKVDKIAKQLKKSLGMEAGLITEIVPAFEHILGKQDSVRELVGVEEQNRFNYIFGKLMQCITAENPLVFFIDDLQWADLATLNLIISLLRNGAIKNLLIVGAYRDNEVNKVHPLGMMLHEAAREGIEISEIKLEGLRKIDVDELLADSFSPASRDISKLSTIIFDRTNGNTFYILQMIKALYENGLLQFAIQKEKWGWQLDKIKSLDVSENVIDLLTSKISEMDKASQDLLKSAACIGNSFHLEHLKSILTLDDQNFDATLIKVREEGLIKDTGGDYMFVHDKIQQAVYSLINLDDRAPIHYRIGLVFLEDLFKNDESELLFNVIDQLNAGIDLVKDQEERTKYAELNLRAGNQARKSTGYDSALVYFNTGLSFIDNDWGDFYDLTLKLHKGAAISAYLSGDSDHMEVHAKQVLEYGKELLHKIAVYNIQIEALKSDNRLLEAVEKGLEVLGLLGIKIPLNPNKSMILFEYGKSRITMVGKSVENLLDLPEMEDPYKIASLQILLSIGPAVYWASPNLIPLTIIEMVKLSVKYGNANESVFAYATYGLLLCGLTKEIKLGNRYGQLALDLAKRVDVGNRVKGVFSVYCFVHHWKHPIRLSYDPFKQSFREGLESGNLEFAALSAYLYCNHSFYAGQPLDELDKEMKEYADEIRKIKQDTPLNYNLLHWQTVQNLRNVNINPVLLKGDVYNEEIEIPRHIKAKDHTALFKYHLLKMYLHYTFQQVDEALDHAEKAKEYQQAVTGMLVSLVYEFYYGLTLIASLHNAKETSRQARLKLVRSKLRLLKKWAHECPENHSHKYHLMLAEYSRLTSTDHNVIEKYQIAINESRNQGFLQDEALANELLGTYYFDNGNSQLANFYFVNAFITYQKWGALSKCENLKHKYELDKYVEDYFSHLNEGFNVPVPTLQTDQIDISTILKASTAITSQLDFESLKSSLLKILVENAGAQKGIFLITNEQNIKIEHFWPEDQHEVEVAYPETVIKLCMRSGEMIVTANAGTDQRFNTDTYVITNKIKSMLCYPVVYRGDIIAIIYLENNLTYGVFSEERISILRMLSGQIAVSVRNSLLYKDLGNAYNEQVSLREAYSKFVPREVLKFLGKESILDVSLGDQVQREVTTMFIDIVDYTTLSESMTPKENFNFINGFLHRIGPSIENSNGFICSFLGDGLMAIFKNKPGNALNAAILIQKVVIDYNKQRRERNRKEFQVGIGLHTGKVILGIIGDSLRMDQNVISDNVNIASRVQDLTRFYGTSILLTRAVFEKIEPNSGLNFRNMGRVVLKGKKEDIEILECVDGLDTTQKNLKIDTIDDFEQGKKCYSNKEFSSAVMHFEKVLSLNPDDKAAKYFLNNSARLLTEGVKGNRTDFDQILQ